VRWYGNDTGVSVQRIYFTADDLARTSVVNTLGPIAETVFAMDALGRSDGVAYAEWYKQVQFTLGRSPAPLGALTRQLRPVPDLLWLLDRPSPPEESRLKRVGMTRQQVAAVVQEFHRLVIVPRWRRIRGYLEAEREVRARIMTTGGIGRLLTTVHPQAQWQAPVLELPLERHSEVRLGGRGLLLTPSLFLSSRSCVLVEAHGRARRPVLVFPTPPDRAGAKLLWESDAQGQQALSALIGRTRAAILDALTESQTTGELAGRLGITAAGISQHTSVLRRAGLITTRRNRNMALHNLTALGVALLDGHTGGFGPTAELNT
jgi:DNA-binding transcriptional ArsR family regulator